MSKILDQAISRSADETTWDFACPGVKGSPCGDAGTPFTSTGWPTKATAQARGQEHFDEHKGKGAMSTLEDFRAKHNLVVTEDGAAVSLEDI